MQPLVSIIVITYNSSEFVLETLESAKNQTYKNIELIVTDDGSTDNTLKICEEWIAGNSSHFKRVKLLTSVTNRGTPANCNRGVSVSNGAWIKLIAGDDLLDRDLLLRQIDYINSHSDVYVLWTNVATFYDTEQERVFRVPEGTSRLSINRDGVTCEQQFQILLRQNPVYMGGLLIKKEVLTEVGLFDETYPSFEDLPFLHKALMKHYKLHYLDIVGAYYRKHPASVQVKDFHKLRSSYHTDVYKYEMSILKYYMNFPERFFRFMDAGYNLFFIRYVSNKKNSINKILLYGPSAMLRQVIRSMSKRYNYI